tara:strand:- start:300 stop:974 length:675 start_codon:yes stop_codon:yes gene_type:complete
MSEDKFLEPFSPAILERQVPQKFIDIVNRVGDEVLSDETKSREWDFSENLVGKVRKEVQIPIVDKAEKKYCLDYMKESCLLFLQEMLKKNRTYEWNKLTGVGTSQNLYPSPENIHLANSWIVSQYKGEYNPWHKHSGNFSAVMYLKIPEGMNDFMEKEYEDHYPSSGLIQFMYGESQDFRSDTLTCLPEVGKMYLFPSWLKHSVYPFYCEGERRSLSFNAFFRK